MYNFPIIYLWFYCFLQGSGSSRYGFSHFQCMEVRFIHNMQDIAHCMVLFWTCLISLHARQGFCQSLVGVGVSNLSSCQVRITTLLWCMTIMKYVHYMKIISDSLKGSANTTNPPTAVVQIPLLIQDRFPRTSIGTGYVEL